MNATATLHADAPSNALSTTGRYLVLVSAFLGWFCAGFIMATTTLAMQSAALDLLSRTGQLDIAEYRLLSRQAEAAKSSRSVQALAPRVQERLESWKTTTTRWFAWYQCAFLFGAATGGLVFGRIGDRFGRARAMGLSILMYSTMAGVSYFAQSPVQLLVLWYLACTGVGGMWPNGVALVSEVWSHMSRPFVAGLIGTSANIGIFLFATAAEQIAVTPESWRWVLFAGAAPVILGLFVLAVVPESPRWQAARQEVTRQHNAGARATWEIFRPPLLVSTVIGITLATVPLVGAWGSANWMVPWAERAGEAATVPNPYLKANVQKSRAFTGMIGSLCGGWIGSLLGRRRAYFIISLVALFIAQYTFWNLKPTDETFLLWVGGLGFFSGVYFGWLPLFLPELFPARMRSTGAGVSFNFGRILTAITVFITGALTALFDGDYARMGRITSLVFAIGMVAILFAPDTSQRSMNE